MNLRDVSLTGTRTAKAPSAVKTCVRFVVGVALRAMRSSGFSRSNTIAPQGILAWRNRLKMGWINAMSDTAQVIQLQAVRDGSTQRLISPAVSKDGYVTTTKAKGAVAIIEVGRPKPTRVGFVDLNPKAFIFSHGQLRAQVNRHVPIAAAAGVMPQTEPQAINRILTIINSALLSHTPSMGHRKPDVKRGI